MVKNLFASAGDLRDLGSIPGLRRSPQGGHGNPLQYSCLENSWTEEAGGLQSVGLQGTAQNGAAEHAHRHAELVTTRQALLGGLSLSPVGSLHHPWEVSNGNHSQVTNKEAEAHNSKIRHPGSSN